MLYREWTDRGMDGECKREWTSLSYIQPISHLQKPINRPAMIEAISLIYSNPGCPAVAVGLALPKIITEIGVLEREKMCIKRASVLRGESVNTTEVPYKTHLHYYFI